MKIAIDARMIESSGIGTYIKTCLKSEIYSVALGDAEKISKYFPNIKVIPFDEKIYGIKEQFCFPKKALKKEKIDLLHVPHYNIPLFYRGKTIVTIHDLTHLYFPEFLPNIFARFYARFMLKKAAKRSFRILTVSNFVKDEIAAKIKVPKTKISVVYNAYDKDFKVKNKSEIQYLYDKFSIPRNKKIILFVGNLKPHKNLSSLVTAYQKSHLTKDSVLLLVGKSFDKDSNDICNFDNGTIIKTGAVSKNELIDIYNLSDLFVFPSLSEGFGIPPLEAMACGTPVICSNTTSLPEVVGDAATMFNPHNTDEIASAIDKILTDNNLSNELIQKGFERIKLFDEEKIFNTLKEFFQNNERLFDKIKK